MPKGSSPTEKELRAFSKVGHYRLGPIVVGSCPEMSGNMGGTTLREAHPLAAVCILTSCCHILVLKTALFVSACKEMVPLNVFLDLSAFFLFASSQDHAKQPRAGPGEWTLVPLPNRNSFLVTSIPYSYDHLAGWVPPEPRLG